MSGESGSIEGAHFGNVAGREVSLFTLTNVHGWRAKISSYGATVTELWVPDRTGALEDIVLGFETLEQYVASNFYFGGTIGRVANRIKNARFELDGQAYELARNDGANHLHGGKRGFNHVVWSAKKLTRSEGPALELTYRSPDSEEGYPNTLNARVIYQLTNRGELCVEMHAESDGSTLVNLAHHSYFNLSGHASGTILDHELRLDANEYSVADRDPAKLVPVAGSAFDFGDFKPIGRDLARAGSTGYDHNYVPLGTPGALREVACVREPKSGRTLTLESDQPGLQFYCGSFLDGSAHGKGARYERYSGFCLESQKFPFAINVPAWREQVILRPGEAYRHRMIHRFSVDAH